MTKKKLLVITIFGLALSYVLNNPLSFKICFDVYTLSGHTYCRDEFQYFFSHLLWFLLFPLLPFSLFTLPLKEEVFQVWWRFARWFVPVIIVFMFIFEHSSGGGMVGGGFDFLFGIILYFTFILVSLVKIVRAHKRLKRQEESTPGFQKEPQMTLGESIAYRLRNRGK